MHIKDIRKRLKLSQSKVSQILNIEQSTYCRWERGDCYPSIPMIHKLAKVLGVTPEEVFKSFSVKES